MQAQNVARWVVMDIYAHSGEGQWYDWGVEACKEGYYINSAFFYMHLGVK